VVNRTAPMGTNIMPMMKNVGMTDLAVITGCHAGNLCCLKAVSLKKRELILGKTTFKT